MEGLLSLLCSLVCCFGGCFFWIVVFLGIVGLLALRKRGKQNVTVKEAVSAGAASVSQVFVRGQNGLEDVDDD